MEKTEPEKTKENNEPEYFLERAFDEEEHFIKLKNKSAYLLDSQNEKTFKTIHFYYDEACKEKNTFSDKKIEKINWTEYFTEKNLSN